ncbi:hypothetical protein OAN24_03950 [Pseudodesulfovibrio sp.]|nr:hypothetical protein [Pseudodesulfovibrio sp.]
MDWHTAVSSLLILFGAALMLVNIIRHRHTIQAANEHSGEQNRLTKTLVSAHLVFMIFFFFGYVAVLYLFLKKIDFSSYLFVAVIFFFGAIFVFMGIVIQKRMYSILQANNEILKEYNTRLKKEQERCAFPRNSDHQLKWNLRP